MGRPDVITKTMGKSTKYHGEIWAGPLHIMEKLWTDPLHMEKIWEKPYEYGL